MFRKLTWFISALLFVSASISYGAETNPKKNIKKTSKKSTDLSFEDLLVHGKYHFSDEATATVESDKVLDALLGIRKDFNDRITKSASHH